MKKKLFIYNISNAKMPAFEIADVEIMWYVSLDTP